MTELVPPEDIERLVGATRHPHHHIGRVVSPKCSWDDADNARVYILHSQACVDRGIDLRDCPYSLALDEHGIHGLAWQDKDRDVPRWIRLGALSDDRVVLVPFGPPPSVKPEQQP